MTAGTNNKYNMDCQDFTGTTTAPSTTPVDPMDCGGGG